jgi:5-methylphenazine-1-carboxylate 1-monooxygenase
LSRYEDRRRPETAKVVEANREMHQTGATQRPEDLARVTAKYRTDTDADRSHA